jgi:hypothetical protein
MALTDDWPPPPPRPGSGVAVMDALSPRRRYIADYYMQLLFDQVADAVNRPAWHQFANCRGMPVSMFFPESTRAAANAPAFEVCESCPVRAECRAAGQFEPDGVWGGVRLVPKPWRYRKVASCLT